MKRHIEEILIKCGMPVTFSGFGYITEAIMVLLNEPQIKIIALYEIVAKRLGSTSGRVERGIRYAFIQTRKNGDVEQINKYFGTVSHNSNSLKMIAWRIKSEMEETANEANS